MDGGGALSGVCEASAGVVQALVAYPGCDRLPFVLEEAVQVAGGDVVRGGNAARGQARVVQVLLDEGTDS
ncbi:hypothetical protein GCM10009548_87070 [Streptomyces malaysiensis subsp. malaysiensis]